MICCSFHTKPWDSEEEGDKSKPLRDSASFAMLLSSHLVSVFSASTGIFWTHPVLKPPGQSSLWVLYWHRVGPDEDSVWSPDSLWHREQTMVTGRCCYVFCLLWWDCNYPHNRDLLTSGHHQGRVDSREGWLEQVTLKQKMSNSALRGAFTTAQSS